MHRGHASLGFVISHTLSTLVLLDGTLFFSPKTKDNSTDKPQRKNKEKITLMAHWFYRHQLAPQKSQL